MALVDTCFNKAIEGLGALTVNVSEAAFPVPPLVEVTALLVLAYVPALAAVTLTETVQLPPAGTVALPRLTLVVVGVVTAPPVQLVAAFGVPAFCNPGG